MEEKIHQGVVSFVHHQKHYATIDYTDGTKKKTINFQTDAKNEATSGISKKDKKHHFRSGDTVNFQLKLTPRGDRLNAYNVKFLYNHELDKMLQKANTDNRFKGFLKVVDEGYYVKELQSYLFFPLVLSPWQVKPPEQTFNEAFEFRLVNMEKQNISAELIHPVFIPAYKTAQKYFRDKTVINATVSKVSPFGVYVDVVGKDVQAKLPIQESEKDQLKEGYKVNVVISFLSNTKIVIERVK